MKSFPTAPTDVKAAKPIAATFPATTRRRSSAERGLTLFELVVVVVIIAVAAALTMPNLTAGARQREVRRTMQQFVSAVRRASSVAVFTRKPVEMRIDIEDRRYRIVVPKTEAELAEEEEARENTVRRLGTGMKDDSEDELGGEVRLDVILPEAARFGELEGGGILYEEDMLIRFHPNGSSSGGMVEIVFNAGERNEQAYKLRINPLTSAISFADEDEA